MIFLSSAFVHSILSKYLNSHSMNTRSRHDADYVTVSSRLGNALVVIFDYWANTISTVEMNRNRNFDVFTN